MEIARVICVLFYQLTEYKFQKVDLKSPEILQHFVTIEQVEEITSVWATGSPVML